MMDSETIRMPDEMVEQLEELVERGWYESRSEAVRDGIRRLLEHHQLLDNGRTGDLPPWFQKQRESVRADGGGR